MLRVDRIGPPVPGGIDENGRVIEGIEPAAPRGIGPRAAGEDRDVVPPYKVRYARDPLWPAPQKIGNRRFRPDDQVRSRKLIRDVPGAVEQSPDHAVSVRRVPLLAEPF